jgi:hypothetical protein
MICMECSVVEKESKRRSTMVNKNEHGNVRPSVVMQPGELVKMDGRESQMMSKGELK